ncbi:hypothetical protein ACIBLA_26825 [Streptomyces sp. NPDC050433]|uniref:hypothetical protein n=1 Tax=Streptomyces sp. NPDC050433 TaxID=3365615 RepID=UPI0037AB356A
MGPVNVARVPEERGFPLEVQEFPTSLQELTMADLAFVVTTIALFALVAFVAKGVAKL